MTPTTPLTETPTRYSICALPAGHPAWRHFVIDVISYNGGHTWAISEFGEQVWLDRNGELQDRPDWLPLDTALTVARAYATTRVLTSANGTLTVAEVLTRTDLRW